MKKRHFRSLFCTAALLLSASALAQNVRLFETLKGAVPYRIPSIAACRNGNIIAVSDYRYCGQDIGFGAVDLHYRISSDNGSTWSREEALAAGTGTGDENVAGYAYGDAAMVADSQSDEVLLLCVTGKMVYFNSRRDNPNRVARFRSHDNGETWDGGEEITDQIYGLFDNRSGGAVEGLFFGSGKICQSRLVKVGKYYRLYAAVITHSGVFAVYSDDFGDTWSILGDVENSPCPAGDEPKCEELPDGRVVLSVRTEGRFFNVFMFSDRENAVGKWDEPVLADAFGGIQNACNGEVLLVQARRQSDNQPVCLLLQSIPFGPQRANVGFFYKELVHESDYSTSAAMNEGWTRGLQMSHEVSAYSTMTQLADGHVAFLWEEGPTNYNIDFRKLAVGEITLGKYY